MLKRALAGPSRHRCHAFMLAPYLSCQLKGKHGTHRRFFNTPPRKTATAPTKAGMLQFPHTFFSTFGLYQIKDLIKHVKRSRSPLNEQRAQPRLGDLLQDKAYLAAFHSYLQSEFSDENIEFWLTCENFRATASQANLPWKARGIYKEFIQPAACKEINVDQHIREEIKKSLDQPSRTCFDEAQKHVYLLMERDSCPRFLQSDAFLRLKQKPRTMWYI